MSQLTTNRVVVKDVRYMLAHVPGLVQYGSKPVRELPGDAALREQLGARLRSFDDAAAYPPHQVFLGARPPEDLWALERPWWHGQADVSSVGPDRSYRGPFGELLDETPFYGFLKIADDFNLVTLSEEFTEEARATLAEHPLITPADLARLGSGQPLARIERSEAAVPLVLGDGRLVGCIRSDHDQDTSLAADVLLENLTCKATAVLALRALLDAGPVPAEQVDYLINCGEEAVG
ncbi:MAG: glycine reductase, partial [Chloroflexota bacterium]|nr:glycine reductase [Chloroflexota bacterium]